MSKPQDIDATCDSDAAYSMAVAHVGYCMWQGFQPWQVIVSVGVAAPTDASWTIALGVIYQKATGIL
ncbi:MAG: hypothetical protein L3J33_03275 [Rhodobacteraceae bacterium]|nr:hypothetical protein [Paracoccaceae bacterium]